MLILEYFFRIGDQLIPDPAESRSQPCIFETLEKKSLKKVGSKLLNIIQNIEFFHSNLFESLITSKDSDPDPELALGCKLITDWLDPDPQHGFKTVPQEDVPTTSDI